MVSLRKVAGRSGIGSGNIRGDVVLGDGYLRSYSTYAWTSGRATTRSIWSAGKARLGLSQSYYSSSITP